MKKRILYDNGKLHVEIQVTDDGLVKLADFSAAEYAAPIPESPKIDVEFVAAMLSSNAAILELQVTGESTVTTQGNKHFGSSYTSGMRYCGDREYENDTGHKIEILLKGENGLNAVYHMQFFKGLSAARTWSVLTNCGNENIGLEFISSFVYHGIAKNGKQSYLYKADLYVPYNNWSSEARWQRLSCEEAGLSRITSEFGIGNSWYCYGNKGSHTTSGYLPMGFVQDRETGEISFWQIDCTGSWYAEYASGADDRLALMLSGPTERDSAWWKNLSPGESFTTVPAVYGVVVGDVSDAAAELTRYRRAIRRPNQDNVICNVVFNDYMNCLMGEPTEEKEYAIIDKAAELGCEYYCVDCGWYADGMWWDTIGEWKESRARFPNGLKSVLDYVRKKGMKPGLWLEFEAMGRKCALAEQLPDDWFFQRHGKRHVDVNRYLLDFRNPEVRKYCREVIDRLIRDYQVEFFKVDYNVNTSLGSDYASDSMGDALLEHVRCLHAWWKEIFCAYPGLVVENCGAGGMRMDYGMLQLLSLQSTSDQTDYIYNSCIAAAVATAVTPEQAGMWAYPYEDDAEHIVYNMVGGMLLRLYVSGKVWNLSERNLLLMKEAISVYKKIRRHIPGAVPFFPLGLNKTGDPVLAYGLQDEEKAFLCVFTPGTDYAEIPLNTKKTVKSVSVLYPEYIGCDYELEEQVLKVKMPKEKCARFFELRYVC